MRQGLLELVGLRRQPRTECGVFVHLLPVRVILGEQAKLKLLLHCRHLLGHQIGDLLLIHATPGQRPQVADLLQRGSQGREVGLEGVDVLLADFHLGAAVQLLQRALDVTDLSECRAELALGLVAQSHQLVALGLGQLDVLGRRGRGRRRRLGGFGLLGLVIVLLRVRRLRGLCSGVVGIPGSECLVVALVLLVRGQGAGVSAHAFASAMKKPPQGRSLVHRLTESGWVGIAVALAGGGQIRVRSAAASARRPAPAAP